VAEYVSAPYYNHMVVIGAIILFSALAIAIPFLIQGPPFVPSSDARIQVILETVRDLGARKIIDLGCGDGKLVVALAQCGYQVDGVELQPWLVWRARRRIRKLGLQHRASIVWGNLWTHSVASYNTVVLYAIPHVMPRLEIKLQRELAAGSRIVSNYFTFPNLSPVKKVKYIYVYKIMR